MYTILGANGHIGSVIAKALLSKGEKVRVVGRHAGKLQAFTQKGAEAFVADATDEQALTKSFAGARAAFLMVPPNPVSPDYRADQEKISDAISGAVKNAGLQYAVNLSSYGAQASAGTGPILGLHNFEQKLNANERLNVLHLRPAYFMENHLQVIQMIQMMGVYGGAAKPDLKIPMIATRDIGEFAAERLMKLDFSGKLVQELLGERDLTMTEVATVISKAVNKPDLQYAQFGYDQVLRFMKQMGMPEKSAATMVEMFQGINEGVVVATQARSAENSTPTSIEVFVRDVFVPAYSGRGVGA
jgi:uncharacterized protein YbjT (DUF2867 family)